MKEGWIINTAKKECCECGLTMTCVYPNKDGTVTCAFCRDLCHK